MPQMSPLLWEMLNVFVMILLVTLLVKTFFFLIQESKSIKSPWPMSNSSEISTQFGWSW